MKIWDFERHWEYLVCGDYLWCKGWPSRTKMLSKLHRIALVDPRGVPGMRPPGRVPNSFIFLQFSAKNLQNNRLAHQLRELAPPLRKSWIRHCYRVFSAKNNPRKWDFSWRTLGKKLIRNTLPPQIWNFSWRT